MRTLITYVDKNYNIQDDNIPCTFLEELVLELVRREACVVGSKTYSKQLTKFAKVYVLSRSKVFPGAKSIKKPEDMPKDCLILGGRSTIASCSPYIDEVILGVGNVEVDSLGKQSLPINLEDYELIDTIPAEEFNVYRCEKKRKV